MQSDTDIADLDLERSVIASLLADNRGFDRIGGLEPDHFFDPTHAAVMAAAFDLRAERRRVDLVTLRSRFANVPFSDEETVIDYLRGIEFAGSAPDVGDMAASIHELAQRRAIKVLGEQIAGSVHDHAVIPPVLLTDAARSIDDLLAKCRPASTTLWAMPEATDAMLSAATNGDEDARIPIGLADLDKAMGGLYRGQVTYLGGRPSMGKSCTAVAFGRRAAAVGHGVIVFSLEMPCREWMARMATDACWSRELPVPYKSALRGELIGPRLEAFRRGAEGLRGLPLLIEERSGLTASDIASGTRRAAEYFQQRGKRLGLVIVDHLGKVRPSSNYRGQKVHEIGEISEAMTHLAKSENVAVLALQQLNRAVESRAIDDRRPTLADLRDAGNLEQDAHNVLFAYRSAYYLERTKGATREKERARVENLEKKRHDLELLIAKQRNGPTTTIDLYCDMAANAIRDRWRGAA
jgi:replicative DNA helicase